MTWIIGPIIGTVALVFAVWRWWEDGQRRRRARLERIGSLVTAVLNAAGSALLLPPRDAEESRRVKATEYAIRDLRVALEDTAGHELPKCQGVAGIERIAPRTIEGDVYPKAVAAREEVEAKLRKQQA